MILRFSEKGSPYIELDDHNRFIFSRLTANENGIKYILYTNAPLNGEMPVRARDNWFTTTYFKNVKNGKMPGAPATNLGIPHSFKSNIYWKNGTISVLRKMIAKYLLPTGEFPESAFPALAEDIVKYNRLADKDKKKLVEYVRNEEKKEEEEEEIKKPEKKIKKEKVKKEKKINKSEKKARKKKTKKVEKEKIKKVKAKTKKTKKIKKVARKKRRR
ncbi:MAG TPA: hypothetical protein P5293_02045 [Bacteroidales bacterium]|nr:hypothetical protein [Bacteroidales bacterium]